MLRGRVALCSFSSAAEVATGRSWSGNLLVNFVRNITTCSARNMSEVGEKRNAALISDGEPNFDVSESKKAKNVEESSQLDQDSSILKAGTNDAAAEAASSGTMLPADFDEKWKLKKYAMCLMYCGKGYFGLQRNPGVKTIEEDLLKACFEAGVITEDALNNPQSIMFQRAARTDKGVSAARQVLSLKLPTKRGTPEEMKRQINSKLVDQIRVVGLKRVTRNFNSKNNADARTYSYILPTFAFAPSDIVADEKYRTTAERVHQVDAYLKLYLGSHNFHNFTSGKLSTDPSAMRYIKEIECGQPFLVGQLEYVQIRIKGQSFMLHQIRKMIGLVVAIMRGHTTESIIKRAWGPEKLDIPKAPALGLMLEQVHYDRYDIRYGGDGVHEALTWTEYQAEINNFKHEHIYPNIWTTEENDESMVSWMTYLPLHTYDVREHETRPSLIEQTFEEDFGEGDVDEEDNNLEEKQKQEIL